MENFKVKISVCLLFIPGVLLMFATGCKKDAKDTLPMVSTDNVSEITATSATSGGNITSDGGSIVTERGVCWNTLQNPTIADDKSTDGSIGTGIFTTSISGLTSNITYYIRAYATNSVGTGYGDEKTFTTSATSDFAATLPATVVRYSGATLNGSVNANYLSTQVTFEYGTTTNYENSIPASQSPVTGNGATNVSAAVTGLSAVTTYHFRVKIVNSAGTAFGSDMTFITNYTVGDTAYGGIVFYCDNSGSHGLVCTTNDLGVGATWGCRGTAIDGTATTINTGEANTDAIVAGCTDADIAAKLCSDLDLNGYDDWYLPSKDELGLIYSNLHAQGLGGFPYAHYWSSSEFDANNAWMLLFGSPMEMDMGSPDKNSMYNVRAIHPY